MLTKEEYISRLKEYKSTFTDNNELVEYILPVLNYFMKYHSPCIIVNGVDISSITVNTPNTPKEYELVIYAYNKLCEKVKEFE